MRPKEILNRYPIVVLLVVFILAILIYDKFCPVVLLQDHYVKHEYHESNFLQCVIRSEAKLTKKGKHYSYVAKVIAYKDKKERKWYKTKGKLQIYIPKEKLRKTLRYGDTVTTRCTISKIRNFDPSFDYVSLMKHKRIYRTAFVKSFKVDRRYRAHNLLELSHDCNERLKNRLARSGLDKKQYSLAVAMVLGNKTELDQEVREAFNVSGIAHILCVSGMHVAIVVGFLGFLLSFVVPPTFTGYYIRNFILILLAWIIAFVVGLTPSSTRVALMLSIFFLCELDLRTYDRYNVLFLCAFIFLLLDPLVLFNVSFQLSFLAIFGIYSLYFKLYRSWSRRRRGQRPKWYTGIANSIAGTISVSVSAQTFCLPVLLYCFKSFPVLFIFTNVLAVPLAGVIMVSLIVLLCVCFVPGLGFLASTITGWELDLLIAIAETTQKVNCFLFG